MTEITETSVTLTARTAQEGLVAVPEACYERCGDLARLIGEAAISDLVGELDAIACNNESNQGLRVFPRRCLAVRGLFGFKGTDAVSPFIIGEHETELWVDRVDQAIRKHAALGVVDARKKITQPH